MEIDTLLEMAENIDQNVDVMKLIEGVNTVTNEFFSTLKEVWEEKQNEIWYSKTSEEFRNYARKELGDGVSVLLGIKDDKSYTKGYRFSKKEGWTMDKAKSWIKKSVKESAVHEKDIDIVKLMESARDIPIEVHSLSENIVYDAFDDLNGKKFETWEEVQDIPGRLIQQGVSKNKVYFTEEFLADPDTIKHFEGCKMYMDHQRKIDADNGEARSVKELIGRWHGVRMSESGNLVADKISFIPGVEESDRVRKIIAHDPTLIGTSIVCDVKGKVVEHEGMDVLIPVKVAGRPPSCDAVSDAAAGGAYNINESHGTNNNDFEGEVTMEKEFTEFTLTEQIDVVKGNAELMEAIKKDIMSEIDASEKEKQLSESLKQSNAEVKELREAITRLKRKNELSELRESVMELIDSQDFGKTGANVLAELKEYWTVKLNECESDVNKDFFGIEEVENDINRFKKIVSAQVKESAKISPDTIAESEKTQEANAKKDEEEIKMLEESVKGLKKSEKDWTINFV